MFNALDYSRFILLLYSYVASPSIACFFARSFHSDTTVHAARLFSAFTAARAARINSTKSTCFFACHGPGRAGKGDIRYTADQDA